jgi:hypothetical protein
MKVRVILHDSTKYESEIAGFDMAIFIEEININPHQMIQFGNIGISKHSIKIIEVAPEPTV